MIFFVYKGICYLKCTFNCISSVLPFICQLHPLSLLLLPPPSLPPCSCPQLTKTTVVRTCLPVQQTRDVHSIPGSGGSPGEGHGNPLQYPCWRVPWTEEPGGLHTVHGGGKELDVTEAA